MTITAKELDEKFDNGEDISEYIDWSSAIRPNKKVQRINVDFATWMVYRLDESVEPTVTVTWDNGTRQNLPTMALPTEIAEQIFRRSGRIRRVELVLARRQLLDE